MRQEDGTSARNERPLRFAVIGAGMAVALSRLMASLIFQVEPTDPTTYLVGSAILLVVATAACGLPARRAAKLDPVTVLKEE